ncbi:plasmid mobilization protein [Arachidicoccus sp.]|uniref:plasmid mobilization protein n=1 Tax=Arachidicoccus sp. TaxID=1872624 RepID=UPI003D1BB308
MGKPSEAFKIRNRELKKKGNLKQTEEKKEQAMEEKTEQNLENNNPKKKGGRPPKTIKRDQLIGVKCTPLERKIIQTKAKIMVLSISDYLRQMALSGTIHLKNKILPKEVLSFAATLNHLAANLNQIAKKRNGFEELTLAERVELKLQSDEVKTPAKEIKNYLLQ